MASKSRSSPATKKQASSASTKRRSAPKGATKSTRKSSADATTKVLQPEAARGNLFVRIWMGLAHGTGAVCRMFRLEPLEPEQRKDGVPFFLVLMAVVGIIMEWFLVSHPTAEFIREHTISFAVGRLSFVLPIVFLAFAFWLFNHPTGTHDNRRIAVGLMFGVLSVTGLSHLFGGMPSVGKVSATELSAAGGVLGWFIGQPLSYLTVWVAVPLLVLLGLLSLLIITKTPPKKIGARLGELYRYLVGEEGTGNVVSASWRD